MSEPIKRKLEEFLEENFPGGIVVIAGVTAEGVYFNAQIGHPVVATGLMDFTKRLMWMKTTEQMLEEQKSE